MQPLTETKINAIEAWLPVAKRLGLEMHGWYEHAGHDWLKIVVQIDASGDVVYHKVPDGYDSHTIIGPKEATDEHYDTLCWVGTEWLRDNRGIGITKTKQGWSSYMPETDNWKGTLKHLDCENCDLAAITAALREVE